MAFDECFKNQKLYKKIADDINSDSGLLSSFQTALDQLSQSTDSKRMLASTTDFDKSIVGSAISAIQDQSESIQKLVSPMQTAMVGSALSSGFKFDGVGDVLLSAYEPMLKQQKMLEEVQASISEFKEKNTTFASLLNTSVYIPSNTTLDSMPKITAGLTAVQNALEPFDGIKLDGAKTVLEQVRMASKAAEASINTSWLKEDSPWRTSLDSVTRIGTTELNGSNSIFSKLIDAESQTAKLLEATSINTDITSAAAQLASIYESDSVRTQGIARLVSDYGDFALSQQKGIQAALNAGRDDDAKWRIGLLDVTSKFLDRQVIWESGIDATAEEIRFYNDTDINDIRTVDKDNDNYDSVIRDSDEDGIESSNNSFFSLIPQEIGYTNRTGSKIGTTEGFEKSRTVRITELGKSIVESIRCINQESEDRGGADVFKLTKKNV